ncbi:MAG: hypothetical protein MJZ05_00125 [Fibrobacter sp.]|nr:hypothetical protein [Fibrobacter sp.]
MKNWMSRCAALIGTVLSLSSFAQDCQEVSLYKNGEDGMVEEALNSFPEKPEWVTNWGDMDGMIPPYIRFSGMKNHASDWTGLLDFEALPLMVKGGFFKARVRSSQKGKVGLWLQGDFGTSAISFKEIPANTTTLVEIPVANLIGNGSARIDKIGVGIFDVPAYQYTILFVDDIAFTCAGNTGARVENVSATSEYVYSNINPGVAAREGKFSKNAYPQTTAAYTVEQRSKIADSTTATIVVSESEHQQIQSFVKETSMTPQRSRKGWFRNMFYLDRNRLKDSVMANPKALSYEAGLFASEEGNRGMPILIGNVDYAYRACADSACNTTKLLNSRMLQAGLPTALVHSSSISLYYDSYFVSTNRQTLPKLEILMDGKWKTLDSNSKVTYEFDGAGVQKIQVKLSEGNVVVNQNLFVEVK